MNLPMHDAVLDGEVTWEAGRVAYYIFDILRIDGRDTTRLPLNERRVLLIKLPMRLPLDTAARPTG